MILDLAVQQTGAVLTPIYPTINVNELEFILNDAAVKTGLRKRTGIVKQRPIHPFQNTFRTSRLYIQSHTGSTSLERTDAQWQ